MAEPSYMDNPVRLIVDNYNWDMVKGELPCHTLRKVILICRENPTRELPIDEVATRISNVRLDVRFIDSLYNGQDPTKDAARLQHLRSAQGLRLGTFFGHLNHEGLALLPHTVGELSLAVGNKADLDAICCLRPWASLGELRLSLGPSLRLEDLKPMPCTSQRGLFFPYLTDDRVDFVINAIPRVVPELRLTGLYFPKSQLTSEGANRLALQIRSFTGLRVDYYIILEPSGEWQPNDEEKANLKSDFGKKSTLNMVSFSMSWLYEDPHATFFSSN